MSKLTDPATCRIAEINYGPWDRLDGDKPFVDGAGPRPPGAMSYPADMTEAEFDAANLPGKDSLYTLLQRDAGGKLVVVPYHVAYKAELEQAATLLRIPPRSLPMPAPASTWSCARRRWSATATSPAT